MRYRKQRDDGWNVEAYFDWTCCMVGVNLSPEPRGFYLHLGPIIIGAWRWESAAIEYRARRKALRQLCAILGSREVYEPAAAERGR